MRIGVGSGNPVKRRAVERAVSGDDVPGDTIVEAVPVPSGVSEQPRGQAETVAGAENRAAAVLDAGDYDVGVGIEGGVATFDALEGTFLVMWAAVDDGDAVGHGAGPNLRLPASVATRIEAGEELGPVMDDRLDTTGIATRGGAAGALTNGRVDRTTALETAVAGALGPFVSELY